MVFTHARKTTGIERCIQHCEDTHDACLELIDHCLEKGSAFAVPDAIRVLEDCSEICRTAADFMVRDSRLHLTVCRACATICEETARGLERLPEDDLIRRGAELVRKCSQSCEALAGVPLA
jgi:hypothetical protein